MYFLVITQILMPGKVKFILSGHDCIMVNRSTWIALVTDSSTITIAEDDVYKPEEFLLFQNYPNPFNPSTTIGYQLTEARYVTLKVYDMLGNELKTLVDGIVPAGVHEVSFNSGNLSSGLYLYKMNSGIYEKTQKMLLLK